MDLCRFHNLFLVYNTSIYHDLLRDYQSLFKPIYIAQEYVYPHSKSILNLLSIFVIFYTTLVQTHKIIEACI